MSHVKKEATRKDPDGRKKHLRPSGKRRVNKRSRQQAKKDL